MKQWSLEIGQRHAAAIPGIISRISIPLGNERRAFVGIISRWCQHDWKKQMLVCHVIASKCL